MTTLAQRYDPAPADARRLEDAIARRNRAYLAWREAADLRTSPALRGGDLIAVTQNANQALDDYERAADDLLRAKVWWRNAGRPW